MRDLVVGLILMMVGAAGLVVTIYGMAEPCKPDPAILIYADLFQVADACTGKRR